jgi:hypothetical protein
LRAKSATEELELWCQQHRIRGGHIGAIVDNEVAPRALDDDSLTALGYSEARQLVKFRGVRLAAAGTGIVDALNWYFPGNLTPDMNVQLLTTNIPFGYMVAPLRPRRLTFFCPPMHTTPVRGARVGRRLSVRVRASRSCSCRRRRPLAVVHERFLKTSWARRRQSVGRRTFRSPFRPSGVR